MASTKNYTALYIGHDGCRALEAFCLHRFGVSVPFEFRSSYDKVSRVYGLIKPSRDKLVTFFIPAGRRLNTYAATRTEVHAWLDQHAPNWERGAPARFQRPETKARIAAENTLPKEPKS